MKYLLIVLATVFIPHTQAFALDMDRLIGAVAPLVKKTETPSLDRSLREENPRVSSKRVLKKEDRNRRQPTIYQVQEERRRKREKAVEENGFMATGLSNSAD